ncbi:MAG TPA: hypothetical protein VE954_10605 [Oligoflexus sp.]|nr:hypothetical protein [Oligoflexus sp.]HYX33554.1 hypothetical protein [Oligoflexus sp.]
MRSWNDYKATFATDDDVHEAARTGNMLQLARLTKQKGDLDRKNAKAIPL